MRAAVVAGMMLSMSAATAAGAQDVPACRAVAPAVDVPAGQLPATLAFAVKTDVGAYALPGEDFDATDEIRLNVRHRLMWVRRHGIRWVIAVENGGRLYNQTVLAYDMPPGAGATRVGSVMAFPGTVCQLTERQLWRPEEESGGLIAPVPPR